MASKDTVSNEQLYTAIMGVQADVGDKIDKLHTRMNNVIENRITPLEVWKANLMGQIAIITLGLGFVINFATEWVKNKFLKG